MSDARIEQATDWLLRLQEDDVADEEIVRWIDWCETHVDNRKAFQSQLTLWQAFDGRDPALVLSLLEERVAAARSQQTLTQKWRRGLRAPLLRQPLAWAALVLLAVGTIIAVKQHRGDVSELSPVATLKSQPGHIRPAVLPDGSKLDLGARSTVAIHFTGERRQVEMGDGEAFFIVKPDKSKPFVVHAGDVHVTAVGTQFNVQKTGERVVVTVSEGAVRIDAGGSAASQPMLAPAGYQVIYDAASSKEPTMRAIDPVAAQSWREGHLEYYAEPLFSVVATLNRYSEQKVVLEDPTLARLNYTGTIEVKSLHEWLQALPRIFPVQVEQAAGGELRIARRPE